MKTAHANKDLFAGFVDAGVDYITSTCNDKRRAEKLEAHAQLWLADEISQGCEFTRWSGLGYEGVSAGSVQIGKRFDGIMVRVTGSEAFKYFDTIMDHATNVSRIDYQSTFRLTQPDFRLAEYVEKKSKLYKKSINGRWRVRLLRDDTTGNTVYFGVRKSDRFSRVYDKGAETKLPELGGCWRAEVQYQNKLAWHRANELCRLPNKGGRLGDIVCLEMLRRGVPWPRVPAGPPTVAQLLIPPKAKADSLRKIEWLRYQVAPTIRRLRDRVSREELLEVLGLDVE